MTGSPCRKAVGQPLTPGAGSQIGRDLHGQKPFRGVRRDVELAGMEHLPGKRSAPQVQVVDAATDGIRTLLPDTGRISS